MNPTVAVPPKDTPPPEVVSTPDEASVNAASDTMAAPIDASVAAEAEPTETVPPHITAPIFVSRSMTFPEVVFSLGLASVFFVYAAVAYLHPETVSVAYSSNVIGNTIGHAALAVEISQFVNLFLGILALLNRWRATVYALSGAWLLVIALFKVLNLLG
jgi:hypothetical protein